MTSFIKSSLTSILVLVLGTSLAFAGNQSPKIKDGEHAQSKKTIQIVEGSHLDKKDNVKLETKKSNIKEDERTFNVDGTLTEKGYGKLITVQHHL